MIERRRFPFGLVASDSCASAEKDLDLQIGRSSDSSGADSESPETPSIKTDYDLIAAADFRWVDAIQAWIDDASENDQFRALWTVGDSAGFRAFVFAAIARFDLSKMSRSERLAVYADLATAKRASFPNMVYACNEWRRCLRLLPKTEYEAFLADDWRSLLAACQSSGIRKTLGHVARITPVLARQLALVPPAIQLSALLNVLTELDVPEHLWRRLAAALEDAPPGVLSSLRFKARRIRTFGGFWDFYFHCAERPWLPLDLPESFVGGSALKALRTRAEFEAEGLAMRNCLADEFDEASRGRRAYFYRKGPPAVSVQFVRSSTGWRLGKILGVGNEPLASEDSAPIVAAAGRILAGVADGPPPVGDSTIGVVDRLARLAAERFLADVCDSLAHALSDIHGRSLGPGSNAYCIFESDRGYVQFLDQDGGREFLCEIRSHRYSPDLDQTLDAEAVELIDAAGFSWPRGVRNFRKRFSLADESECRRLALMALGFLCKLFGARSGDRVSVKSYSPYND
jgi:hypothetical protein